MSGSDDNFTGSSFINLTFSEKSSEFVLDLDDNSVKELYNCETKVNCIKSSIQNCSFGRVTKAPITCVIKKCRKIMSGREILSHFLEQHRDHDGCEVKNVRENEKCVFLIDCKDFPLGENVCLGVIAYKGSCQARPRSESNISLAKHYQNLSEHLPVLIIGCLTYSSVVFSNKENSDQLYKACKESGDPKHQMLCIWLASVTTTKSLYATISTQSLDKKTGLEMVTTVRSFYESQDVRNFVCESRDTLNLNNGFLKTLTRDFQNSLELEICLYECDM